MVVDLIVSVLNFAGAACLCVDALRVRKGIRERHGAERFRQILEKQGVASILTDEKGKPLNSDQALSLWFAERILRLSWIGFSLLAGGFFIDLVSTVGAYWPHG